MSLTKILGLDHVGIRVSDFETANSFYQRLGFPILKLTMMATMSFGPITVCG